MFAEAVDRAPPHRPPPIRRGGWLDALRFIVGGLIVLYHFREAAPTPLGVMHPVFDRGYLLTDFFIIDSGYVLARIYADRLAQGRVQLGDFYRQRFLRVVPAHLAVSLALAGLVALAALLGQTPSNPQWFDWSAFPSQLFLVQAYGVPGGHGWNAPTWTLSALLGCYLCLPWLARLTARWSPWLVLAAGVGALLAANLATHAAFGLPVYQMPLGLGFLRALPLFALGAAVAVFAGKIYCSPRLARAIGIFALVGLVAAQAAGPNNLISLGLMTVIIFATGAIPVVRPSKVVEHLALMSFALFLTNEVARIVWYGVFEAMGEGLWPVGVRWMVWTAGLVAAVAGAAVFRYGFDRPVQAWLARSRRTRTDPAKAAARDQATGSAGCLVPHPRRP